jgi:peptide deformylase
MILKIVKYPDPVLLKPGEPVTEFNDELRKLVADMFETTYVSEGIGLAAPQVGVSKRLAVIDVSQGKDPNERLALINPEIILHEGKQYEMEGCLSFPEIFEKVQRAATVRVRAQDEYGNWFERDGENLLSRCLQHEIDHVDGTVFLFRMSALKRNMCLRKIHKLQSAGEW